MRIKKILMVSIILFLIGCPVIRANEVDTYKIELNSSNNTLNEGDSIEINLSVKDINIQSGEKGIGAYEGKLEYNKEIFELIEIKGNENWDKPIENEGYFISVKSDGICTNEEQVLATIVFKIKDNIKTSNEIVQIKDFKVSNAETGISTNDVKLKVKIKGKASYSILLIIVIILLILMLVINYLKKKSKNRK